jgi:outer membrane lipoprotein-sorting protein
MPHHDNPLPTRRTRPFLRMIAIAAAATLVTEAVATVAVAQTIPLPRPAPKARKALQSVAANDITGTTPAPSAARQTAQQQAPVPVLPDPRNRAISGGAIDATQRAQASKVSAYLSSLNSLVGNFVQVAPNGSKTTGEFYMQKPGKVRFAYDAPSPIDLVSDGSSVVVRDRKLATQDIYPLSQTPLRYLLADRIDLLKDTNIIDVSADDVFVTVTIEEKSAIVGTSRLMLMIGAKDNQLKQWTITDPQGYDTTVALYNLNTQKKPDPDLFKIDFTRYDDYKNQN